MTDMSELEAERRYGFDPSERAARSWLWFITHEGNLGVLAGSAATFTEPNYIGNDGPEAFGEAYAHHYWRPLEAA